MENFIQRLDRYKLLNLDDLVHVIRREAETSVLFEMIGTPYERRSVLISVNQPFGKWGKVFHDPAVTLAGVDRLVHDSTMARKKPGPGQTRQYATTNNVAPSAPSDNHTET